jgi:predicted ferric reductase
MVGAVHVNPNLAWYVARASGLVAWGLLATTVLWGLFYAGRLTGRVPPPAWNLDLHRFLGALSVIFVAVHVIGLMADKYVDFGVAQVLIPFSSSWRPGAVAWGVTAMYLLVAVEATSLAKRKLPRKVWRSVHLLSFVLFVFSTVHAIQSGTDLANTFVRVVGLTLLAAAMVAAILRIVRANRNRPAPARSAAAPADRATVSALR